MANLDGVFRREWGPAVAALARWSGDLTVAEDAVQEAFAEALRAWYRTHLVAPARKAGQRAFLEFDGAALVSEVWVNGRPAGRHAGGYAGFRFDVSDLIVPGANLVAVRVDNASHKDVAPLELDIEQ